jgi:hypothetical protein
MITTTEYFDTLLVGAALEHVVSGSYSGPLYGVQMGLIVGSFAPTKTSVLTDITQPIYTGYALQATTFAPASRDANGNISTLSGLILWQMTNNTNPTLVTGWFLVDSGGTHLLMAEMLDTPFSLVDTLSVLGLVALWSANNADPGQGIVVS